MNKYNIDIIENNKTIIVDAILNDTNFYTQNFFLEFIPDEVIVKSVSGYLLKNVPTPLFSSININTDLIQYQPTLCSFMMQPICLSPSNDTDFTNYYNSMLNLSYKLSNFVNRIYSFTFECSGTLDWTTTQSEFVIVLEFIKYKSVR